VLFELKDLYGTVETTEGAEKNSVSSKSRQKGKKIGRWEIDSLVEDGVIVE